MKITCIKCGKTLSGMKGMQNHMKIRHTAPYGNRRSPHYRTTPPTSPLEKKMKANVSTTPKEETDDITSSQSPGIKNKVYDPRDIAECPKKWIPPPEARRRKTVA